MLSAFKNYLIHKGITIQKEGETTISFSNEGLNYIFVFDKNDPFYFRLILPNVLCINDNRNEILDKINDENTKFKVAKSVIINNNVWITVEQFVYTFEKINNLFERSLIVLRTYINDFREEIQV